MTRNVQEAQIIAQIRSLSPPHPIVSSGTLAICRPEDFQRHALTLNHLRTRTRSSLMNLESRFFRIPVKSQTKPQKVCLYVCHLGTAAADELKSNRGSICNCWENRKGLCCLKVGTAQAEPNITPCLLWSNLGQRPKSPDPGWHRILWLELLLYKYLLLRVCDDRVSLGNPHQSRTTRLTTEPF